MIQSFRNHLASIGFHFLNQKNTVSQILTRQRIDVRNSGSALYSKLETYSLFARTLAFSAKLFDSSTDKATLILK